MNWLRGLAAAVIAALTTVVPAQVPAPGSQNLEQFLSNDLSFRSLLAHALFEETQDAAILNLGASGRCENILPVFDETVGAMAPRWKAIVLSALHDNVPAEVLESAMARDAATAVDVLKPYMSAVDSDVTAASKPLLREAVATVIPALGERAADDHPQAIADPERRDRMEFCGLIRRSPPASSLETE